jgi:hypothetical protein
MSKNIMAKNRKINPKDFPRAQNGSRIIEPESVKTEAVEVEGANASVPSMNATQPVEVKLDGEKMESGSKGSSEGFSGRGPALFDLDGFRKMAALYIDTGEKLVERTLDFQAKAGQWAKDTPLAPLFEARISMARKIAELSVDTARRVWRIEGRRAA